MLNHSGFCLTNLHQVRVACPIWALHDDPCSVHPFSIFLSGSNVGATLLSNVKPLLCLAVCAALCPVWPSHDAEGLIQRHHNAFPPTLILLSGLKFTRAITASPRRLPHVITRSNLITAPAQANVETSLALLAAVFKTAGSSSPVSLYIRHVDNQPVFPDLSTAFSYIRRPNHFVLAQY